MAVNKVVNKSTKTHGAMRNVIEYVLRDEKVKEECVDIIGPYAPEKIDWDGVYNAFLSEKKLWNKDSGRMYAHNIISFHKDEKITSEECLEISREFVDEFFPGHQSLICVHRDKDHLHIHIITNSVSYIDGLKLHQTKRDLERQKEFTNELCRERGLSVAEKGKHFDGTTIEEGEVIAWSKNKYNLLQNESKKSFVAECAIAILKAKEQCCNKDKFAERMQERGWHTTWTDKKKHITFQNNNGDKVRDSNLSKSFSLDISKEVLTYEFERQNVLRLAKIKAGRDRAAEREQAEQLDKYYREVETAISGTDTDSQAIGSHTEIADGISRSEENGSGEDTKALIREVRTDISTNRFQNRAVANTENKSITDTEQRRIEDERRSAIEERAAIYSGRSQGYSGSER